MLSTSNTFYTITLAYLIISVLVHIIYIIL